MHTIKNTSAGRSLVATVVAGFLLAAVLAAASTDGSAPTLTIENTQLCHVKLKWTFTQPSDWYSCSIERRKTVDGKWGDWTPLKSVKPDGASYVQCAASDEMGFRAKQGQKYQIRATGYKSGTNAWRASPDSNEVVADLNIGCP